MLGQTISHYKILAKLGEGGMGIVYKAEDTKLKRLVALKFLPSSILASEAEKARFIHEAQAAAALDHPNICTVYEIDEADGQLFIAMAYVEGQSLKEKIETGPLKLDEALGIAMQAAEGLQAAHEKQITHRDIKPANIMLTLKGQVKIMDFGLAKLAGRSALTKEGATLGTVAYMSPEQARGEEVDRRTDIWSFGVVLYEMITGQLPFKGEYEQAVMYSIMNVDPEPMTGLRTGVPMELERIVNKALAKKTNERYQHIEDLLVDLRAIQLRPKSSGVSQPPIKAKVSKRKQLWLYAAVAGLVILLLAGIIYFQPSAEPVSQIDAIAVLPLANLSGDPNQEYFADGVTDALISVLGQIEALRVISRTSVMQYKGGTKPLPAIGRELNVDAVVEGSVQSSGNRVNISVRLIAAETEKRLWSESFERELRDVVTLQREVTLAIAREIKVQITPHEQARLKQTQEVDPEAYQLYLLGRKFREQDTGESVRQGMAYFEQAIAKDPNFAPAYAELVVPYMFFDPTLGKEKAEAKARQAATKALELYNTLAEAYTALGLIREIYDWDWPGAEEAFQRAIALNPGNREAHGEYGLFLSRTGRMEAGLAEMKRAYALDPLSELMNTWMAWVYIWNRQYDEAIEQCRKAITFYPNSGIAHMHLMEAYSLKREYEKAISVSETEAVISMAYPPLGYIGYAYALAGNRDKALAMLDTLLQQQKRGADALMGIACIYTGLGETDEALTQLEQAYAEHSPRFLSYIFDPIYDSLHAEPRFQALLKKLGLER